jgi:hypothetical protein
MVRRDVLVLIPLRMRAHIPTPKIKIYHGKRNLNRNRHTRK